MVLRQRAEGRGQKLNVLHSIEKRYIYAQLLLSQSVAVSLKMANLYLQGLLKHPQAVYYLPGQVTG